jgi:ATPase subunit of ABC transporter with duplicated ATPase domains
MRVESISVKGLFGVFDHEIPLQNRDRVTIIHGPNGFGKTVMLRMIAAVLEGQTEIFEQTPFDEFSLTLDDGTARIVRRHVSTEAERNKPRVRLELQTRDDKGHIETVSQSLETGEVPQGVLERIDSNVPSPYMLTAGGWQIRSEGHLYTLGEILRKISSDHEFHS